MSQFMFDSVEEIWLDFKNHVMKSSSPDFVDSVRPVFYAAYEAALLDVVSLPHRFPEEGSAKIMIEIMRRVSECGDYFKELKKTNS